MAAEHGFTAENLTRNQRSILLYAESVLVDRGGLMTGARINADDIENLKLFASAGLLKFGRIPFKLLKSAAQSSDSYPSTHWIEFTPEAWAMVHELRRIRSLQRGPYATQVFDAIALGSDTES